MLRSLILTLSFVVSGLSGAQAQPREVAGLPSLAPLIESVKGAVVNVDVQKRAEDGPNEMLERFMRPRSGGRSPSEEGPVSPGTGSGFIVDSKGLVLTNNHVVENAVSIRVRLDDGKSFDADVLGRDPLTDVALLKLKGKFDALPSVRLGDSGQVRVGDWVVAIGNPFGLGHSVSAGIISALDRQIGMGRYDQFLQTDAAINPGNSGGPLFNLKGEVIGINSAIIGAATGIGFAVPSSLVKALVPQLERDGSVSRGWLGVGIQDLSPGLGKALGLAVGEGALISSVNEGSPAQKAGMKDEDVVVAIDGEKVASSNGLTRVVALKRPETVVTLNVLRTGKPVELKVKLGLRPDLENIGDVTGKGKAPQAETKQRIGLAFENIDPRMATSMGLPKQGALVVEVTPGSPAERAGLRRGVVVIEVNRRPVRSRDELLAAIREVKSGATALLRLALPGGGVTLAGLEVP